MVSSQYVAAEKLPCRKMTGVPLAGPQLSTCTFRRSVGIIFEVMPSITGISLMVLSFPVF